MWVKAELEDSGINLQWQVRSAVHDGLLCLYDANGNVESTAPRASAVYPDAMRSAGIINIDDAFVEFCGEELFEDMVAAVMRHSSYLLALGYGERPDDIVDWFNDIAELHFIDGVSFRILDGVGEFAGMDGVACTMEKNPEGIFVASMMVRDSIFKVPIEDDDTLILFLISTIPT